MSEVLRVTVPDGDSGRAARLREPGSVDVGGSEPDYRPIEFGGGSFAVVVALTLVLLALFF